MNRPPPYKFPDPVAWEALHGLKPYALAKVPPFLAINAAAAIQQDWSTLDSEAVHCLQAELDTVFETVEATFHVPVGHDVHFDGAQFWVFPRPNKLPAAAVKTPLLDAVAQNEKHPEIFFIPDAAELARIHEGDFVQLCAPSLDQENKGGERFWVQVTHTGSVRIDSETAWAGVIEQGEMVFAHIHGYQDKETIEFTYRNILKTLTTAEILSGKPKK